MEELDLERVKSGGAGNKMMMLLENSISGGETDDGNVLYIQDRGVSRWDTCAAEACLESFGGKLAKLTNFAETGDDNTYTYLASETNLDFVPGGAGLTRYNCRASTVDPRPGQKVIDVNDVKPYSNLCGLVALGKEPNTMEATLRIKEAICRAATRNPPSYD